VKFACSKYPKTQMVSRPARPYSEKKQYAADSLAKFSTPLRAFIGCSVFVVIPFPRLLGASTEHCPRTGSMRQDTGATMPQF
jgi:hypothetical protein